MLVIASTPQGDHVMHPPSLPPTSPLMPIVARPSAVMVRGSGSYLWDEQGRRYLDLIQGWAVNCLGHSPAVLQEALCKQAAQLWNPSPALHNRPQLELAARLVAHSHLNHVFFCNSGAEANEGAIKLARKWGARHGQSPRHEILTTVGSFHGRTLATMAASGKPAFRGKFAPSMPGFRHVPYGDLSAMREAVGPGTVAIMVEPIQGEAGVVVPPPGYLSGLRALCDERDLLLIFDEVQTGMARTGPLFAHQTSGIRPDVMTLGKGLGGGAPLAALLCTAHVSCFEPGDQGGTFNGNPLMTAVGCAVVDSLCQPQFVTHSATSSAALRTGLQQLVQAHGHIGVRGSGMLLAIELKTFDAQRVQQRAFEQGLLINACQPNIVRLMPALNLTLDEVNEALVLLDGALALPRDRDC